MSEVLHGNASGDQLNVSSDKTQAYGLSGNDTLTSDGKSNVLLVGGSGDDSLIMKGGNGTLSGGAGNDTFELTYSATEKISAVIEDLEPTEDKIVVNFEGTDAPQLISLTSGEDSLTSGKDVIWTDGRNFNLTVKSVRENDYFDGDASDEAWKVLKLTNDEREKRNRSQLYFPWDNHSQENLPWLTMSEGLMNAASIRAQEITKLGGQSAFENHNRPDGKGEYKTIFDEAEVNKHYSDYGENLDAGATSATSVMNDWMNSPHHRENILDEKNLNFQKLGVGYNENPEDPTHRVHYWTQLFASNLKPKEMETVSTENLLTAIPQVNTVSNLFVTLSDDPDTYTNYAFVATIDALGGNDSITNLSPMVSISGGNDNDTIDNQFGSDVTINAGAGDDSINFGSRVRRNLIQYQAGDGSDTISGLHSTDTLSISGGEYTPVTLGKDVVISVGAHSITVSDAPKNFSIDGTQSNFFFLTEGNDNFSNTVDGATIEVLSGEAKITNSGASVTIKGGALDDTITNSGASVTISAGTGNDSLVNKAENVLFVYEGGFDTVRGFDESSTLKIPNKIFSSLQSGRNDLILTSPDVTGSIKLLNVRKLDKLNILDADNNPIEIGKADSIFGTDEADNLTNSSDEMIIQAYAGDDTISNSGDMVSINGGDDNDQIQNEGSGVSIVGSGGADSISDSGDSNSISGGTGDDTIKISGKENTINAGTGNDSISVAGSRNVIEYASGDGSDTINGLNEDDTLSISGDNYTSTKSGSDVVVTVGKGKISLVGAANLTKLNIDGTSSSAATVSSSIPSDALKYNGHSYKIFDEGMTWEEAKAYCELLGGHLVVITSANEQAAVQSLIKSKGTKSNYWLGGFKNSSSTSSKLITLTEGDDTYNNSVEGVTIQALGGNDTIYNQNMNVLIDANNGDDVIYNYGFNETIDGGFNTTILGGAGDDTVYNYEAGMVYVYRPDEGDDFISGFGILESLVIDGADFETEKSGSDVLVKVGKNTITLAGAAGLAQPNIVTSTSGINPVNIIRNHDSNTLINGLSSSNWIRNSANEVTITAGASSDDIYNDGSNVVIKGGGGNDQIRSYADSVSIDGGADDDYIYNYGDGSSISGGDGDDTISSAVYGTLSSGLWNTINAGFGDDYISLSGGNNQIFYNAGDGSDTITGLTSNDTINIFGSTYTRSTISNDVVLSVGENSIRLVDAVGLSFNIEGTLGSDSTNSKLITLTENDDTYYNTVGADATILALGGNDSITNNYANVSIEGGAGNDSIRNYSGPSSSNITINAGAGDDTVNLGYYDSNVTVNGGTGNDQVSLGSGGSGNMIVYKSGDGDDTIRGFNATSTLSISGDTYSTTASGSDVIVSVGDSSIRLINAATLAAINIENDTSPANVADDTTTAFEPLDPTEVIVLSENDDSLYNTVEGAEIRALGGNDTVDNNEANVIIYGGADNDTLRNFSEGFYSTINGDAGDDSIRNYGSSSIIEGGTGNDTIANRNDTSNVTINGDAGDDYISNYGASSTIDGGAGDNSIFNENDNVIINGGSDNDSIWNSDAIGGDNVSINGNAGDDYIVNGRAYIDEYGNLTEHDGGSNLTINGGAGNDEAWNFGNNAIINGNEDADYLYNGNIHKKGGTNVTINGDDGDDHLWNRGDSVTINGGAGNDSISLDSSASNNVINYNPGDGDDTIIGFNSTSTLSISGASYSTTTSGNDVIVSVGEGSIRLIDAASLSALNIDSEEDTTSGDSVTITNSTSNTVVTGTSGDDSITNSGDNVTIQALGGNDTVWNDGEDVTIDGGAGNDSIYYHGPDTGTTTNVSINGGANSDTIYNRSGDTVTLNGGAGNDLINNWEGYYATILGGEGNDTLNNDSSKYVTLDGGTGDDQISLTSSALYNLIQYKAGDDNDTIYGFNATSTLSIAGAEYSTVTSGNDIIITVGDGSIRLIDAATLSALNIEGTINSSSGDDSWQWVTGETWDYTNWGVNQPDNYDGSENRLMMNTEDATWNDLAANGGSDDYWNSDLGKDNVGFICEWETVPSKLIKLTEGPDTYSESMESGTTLKALGGDDYILSHSGYVLIEGGIGNDTLQNYVDDETSSSYATILGGAGDDSIENHGSHASIEGGVGNDTIWNNDDEADYATILGGIGQDVIYNHGASSIIDGGKGDDSIENHGANVSINSGAGNNYIQNGDGYGTTLAVNVTINTGEGNNTVRNWSTNLFVNMGSGDDSIYNDGANATLNGGAGNDSISNFNSSVYVNGGEGNDTLLNGSGWDGSNNFITKNVTLNGGAGNDSIWNDSNNSTIAGGAGSDTIDNHGKNTTIIGGKDNDEINLASDSKNNFVQYFLGDGNDIVWGITKNDTLNILEHDSKRFSAKNVSSVLSGNDIILTVGKGTANEGTITLKDAKDKRPHIILGESGSSGGGSGGSGGGGSSGGGGGGGGSSGGTSGSAGSNSAASASNSASGNSGTSSSNGGSSGRGNNTVVTRQTVVNFEQPPSPNGNQIISNYQSGEKLHFNADYSGALFDSKNNFVAGFSTGAIIVPDAMDKVIDIRDNSDNQLIKAYAASKPGVIDGRRLGGFEIIKGSAGADEIYSGRGGAQMIGGAGNDTLTGWKGVDIFITGKTQGSDLIRNSSVLDKVNLTDINWSDVVSTSENGNSVILRFNSGNSITVESSEALSSTFMFADGSARCYNYSTKSWQTMKESPVNGTPKIYEGGSQSISSYKSGERIIFNADYKGGSYDGAGNFSVNSSKGMLVVQNAMDKVIDLRNGANNPIIKAYAASKPGTIDGRNIAGFELINGSSGADVICAGDGGSQLWGGAGDAADVLIGGDGADVFIGGRTQGADLIQNASSADTVNFNDATLADIVATSENNGAISLAFNTGNVINVQSSETMSAKFTLADGSSYRYNHSRKTWQSA